MLEAHIDHVAVRVPDVEATLEFYSHVLGAESAKVFPEGSDWGRIDMIALGPGAAIETFEEGRGFGADDCPPVGFIHVAVGVSDVDAAYERAVGSGCQTLRPPTDIELPLQPGVVPRTAFVYGPSGEVIEFITSGWRSALNYATREGA
jgi:catechol 2,3-dioxygenase-like lactoylglutathione lyase family enzyme